MPKLRLKHLYSAKARRIRRADMARDRGAATEAARLYGEVIKNWGPEFGLLIQWGNALKDSGSYPEAEQAYLAALAIDPNDADAYLQRGHLMKLAGDIGSAQRFYTKAKLLDPSLVDPQRELDQIFFKMPGLSHSSRSKGSNILEMRPDMPLAASIVYKRIFNQYQWRRG